MITITLKKAYKGNIDIRSTIVEKAIEDNVPVKVLCDVFEGQSIYTVDELKNPIKKQGPFTSKFDSKPYYLHVFKWKF